MSLGKVCVLLFLLVQSFCIFGDITEKLSDHQSPPERRVHRSTPTEFFFDDEPLTSVRNVRQFNKSLITWRISHFTNQDGLAFDDIVPVIKNAFRIWSAVTPLKFQQTTENADIDFNFSDSSDDPTCGIPFESHVLAHCTSSQPIGIHFNGDVDWAIGKVPLPFIDLYTVLIHEIGHALGLNHADINTAVMHRKYNGRMNRLTGHDIRAIRELYGTKENPKIPVSQSPPITSPWDPALICPKTTQVSSSTAGPMSCPVCPTPVQVACPVCSTPSAAVTPSTDVYKAPVPTLLIKPPSPGNASCVEGIFYCGWELAQLGYTNTINHGLYKCNGERYIKNNGHYYKTCESNCTGGNYISSYCSCGVARYCGYELMMSNFNFHGLEQHTAYQCQNHSSVRILEKCVQCQHGRCVWGSVSCIVGEKYCRYELMGLISDFRNPHDLFECTDGLKTRFLETCSGGCVISSPSFCQYDKIAEKP